LLKGKKDAFGKLIMDYHNGEHVSEIIERDDGFISLGGGPKAYFSTFDLWRPQVQEAISLAKGRILDIGCGAGRFAIHLQEKGFDVVGIDNSELAIKVSKARGLKNALPVGIDEITTSLGQFDTVLMLGNGFGLMQSFDNARRILKQLAEISSDDAQILAESINPYGKDFINYSAYFEKNRKKRRMYGQMRMRIRHLVCKTPYFDFLLVSPDEIRSILEGTGWYLNIIIGDINNGFIAIIAKK
jgi:2-polyprenyl-3-methyl-5-hydroxy-6-metoxy-1,4-benzoquinol methylase